jgi:quercetin dioxygenase-like cupin family protein
MTTLHPGKPIYRSPLRRALLFVVLTLGVAVLTAVPALATPPSPSGPPAAPPYLMTEIISKCNFGELDVFAKTQIAPDVFWKLRIDSKGDTDVYVVRNTFQSGATTGWHTHPGPSLITVTAGTITAYEGNDPSCTAHDYAAGTCFIDPGGGHVHLLRNEGNVDAVTVAVQLIPTGFPRRIDVTPAPGNCQF